MIINDKFAIPFLDLKLFSQMLHTKNGFFPSWTDAMWVFKSLLRPKAALWYDGNSGCGVLRWGTQT